VAHHEAVRLPHKRLNLGNTISAGRWKLKLVLVLFNPDFINTAAQAADTERQLARAPLPTLFSLASAMYFDERGPDRPFKKGEDLRMTHRPLQRSVVSAWRHLPAVVQLRSFFFASGSRVSVGKRRASSIFRHTAPNATTIDGAQRR
jgi:hypothetical protein